MGFDVQKSYEELLKIKSLPPDKFKDWKEKKKVGYSKISL